jgi:hypothetical protein
MSEQISFSRRRRHGGGGGDYNIIIEALLTPDVVMENDEMSTIDPGEVVYSGIDGHIRRAIADNLATAEAIGFCIESIDPGITGRVRVDGLLELDPFVWDTLIEEGSPGGLVPGTVYFLSAHIAGKITANPPAPSDVDEYVTALGRALTSRILKIEIEYPIGT